MMKDEEMNFHFNCTQQQNTCTTVLTKFLLFLQLLSFRVMLTVSKIILLSFINKFT